METDLLDDMSLDAIARSNALALVPRMDEVVIQK
jgi:hypothetical protein